MNDPVRGRYAFLRLLSSAVLIQAMLSAANFAVGLVLIRGTSDIQYGYYILATNALLLLVSLQNAFFNPPIATRIHELDGAGRSALVGGLYREQHRLVPAAAGIASLATLGLWYAGMLHATTGPLALATIGTALAILRREYFRMVLFAYRRTLDVLRGDVLYAVTIIGGASLAILTPFPAIFAVFSLSMAALLSGLLLSRTLRRYESWSTTRASGLLRAIAPISAWSTAGAAIHWTFSQGYVYLVVGTLDVTAVAAIAATRLLMMPVNLLSTGIGTLMLPVASGWLRQDGPTVLRRRLIMMATGVGSLSLCYFLLLWFMRADIFDVLLRKHFEHSDRLLLLWASIFMVMVVRDQLSLQLSAAARFKVLSLLTLLSAALSLTASYVGMLHFGVSGALLGILLGELINVTGIVLFSLRGSEPPREAHAPTSVTAA